ncbi:MAG: hypothetical protein QNJ70_25980 [Xenococcaceae cyanobacterium MO_207.B15]|nr:hypothetical protein [Xenococcaceae cyanobacterium MO_207.B15]
MKQGEVIPVKKNNGTPHLLRANAVCQDNKNMWLTFFDLGLLVTTVSVIYELRIRSHLNQLIEFYSCRSN